LNSVEGIALFGSLARGYDWHEYSDIDIVVVVKKKKPGLESEGVWSHRLRKALRHYGRDVTTFVYTVATVKEIPWWETLRMATDAVVLVDNNGVRQLFKAMVKAAEDAGLRQKWIKDHWVWYKPHMKVDEVIEFRVK
jgi:predicted nucleotidyltransferase